MAKAKKHKMVDAIIGFLHPIRAGNFEHRLNMFHYPEKNNRQQKSTANIAPGWRASTQGAPADA